MDNKEEVKKLSDLGVDLTETGAKLEEEEENVEAKAETMDELEGADKRIGRAMLAKIMPTLEKWEIGLLWQVLEDAKDDPEGMDITRFYESAMSVARAIAENYLVAARDEDETMFSLVIKKSQPMACLNYKIKNISLHTPRPISRGKTDLALQFPGCPLD